MKYGWVGIVLLASCAAHSWRVGGEATSSHENLQVLPADITEDELGDIMLDMLRGLGLRRRAGEGCLHCHVGSLDVPRAEWDFASDAKPAKAKARGMLRMTLEINQRHLADLSDRADPPVEVTCYTCHKGRINPMPLSDLLYSRHGQAGFDGLASTYDDLREKHFGSPAYDFRVSTLIHVADRLVADDELEAAARVHELNAEHNPVPRALRGAPSIRMRQALADGDIDAMLGRYHEEKSKTPEAFDPLLLDRLGWSLFRSGNEPAGMRLFELNYDEHPKSYVATEDLAWGLASTGNKARAITLAEAWVRANPAHETGQRLLKELREFEPK